MKRQSLIFSIVYALLFQLQAAIYTPNGPLQINPQSSGNVLRVGSTGVGVNIDATQALHVSGNGIFTGNLVVVDLIATGTLTHSGTTSFDGASVFNESGAAVDFRVEGDTEANLLFIDASADKIGIGTATPAANLHVVGDIFATGRIYTDDTTDSTSTTTGSIQTDGGLGVAKDLWVGSEIKFPTTGSGLTTNSTTLGMKLAVYGSANGIGIQTSVLEFINGTSSGDYRWGYGTSGSLTEVMFLDSGTGELKLSAGTEDMYLSSPSTGSMIFRSGTSSITGVGNSGFGDGSLNALTSGTYNVAIGYDALAISTAADTAIAIGKSAMAAGTATGPNNIGIGTTALEDVTSGDYNVAVGSSAMKNATTASKSIAIGVNSMGLGVATGNFNVGVGRQTLYDLTSGTHNTALGDLSLNNITDGTYNIAVGASALNVSTSADNTIAIGRDVMGAGDVSGDDNIGVGYEALKNLTSGVANIAIGLDAMSTGTVTGVHNISIGSESADDLTSGSYNVAIGFHSLLNATTSNQNIAIGNQAMKGIVTGGYNVGIGTHALNDLTSGTHNNALGMYALTNLTTGTHNVGFGYQAGDLITTGDYNIMLGANTDPQAAGNDYELNIGNTIYGDLTNDYVGVGTFPTYALHVSGNAKITGAVTFDSTITHSGALSIDDTTDSTSTTTGSIQTDGGIGISKSVIVGYGGVINEAGGDYDFRIEGDTDTNLFFTDASTDRVGIGTATPVSTLEVTGIITATASGGGENAAFVSSSANPAFAWHESDASADNGIWDVLAVSEDLAFRVVNDANSANTYWLQVARTGMTIDTVTIPNGQFRVDDATDSTSTTTGSIQTDGGVGIAKDLYVGGGLVKLESAGEALVLMTPAATSTARLEVGNGRGGSGYSYIDFVGDTTYTDYGLRLIRSNSGANASSSLLHRGTGALNIETSEAAPILFKTTAAERMRILAGGDIGIGTSTPDMMLHVQQHDLSHTRTPNGREAIVVEGSSLGSMISLVGDSGASTQGAVWFVDHDVDSPRGRLRYEFDNDIMEFWVGGGHELSLDSGGNLIPAANETQDLGSASFAFRDVYTEDLMLTSDLRKKENIEPLSHGLKEIMALKPVSYNFIGRADSRRQLGLIAQDVEPVISEVVNTGNDPEQSKAIRYHNLVPVLIKATQEQSAIDAGHRKEINQQKKKIDKLQQENGLLKKRLERLEKLLLK